MQFDDLKNQWKNEMDAEKELNSSSISEIKQKILKLDRSIYYGNLYTLLAAIGLSVYFFYKLITVNMGTLTQIGILFIIGVFFYIIFLTINSSIFRDDNWTISSRISSEIKKLETQKKLGNYIVSIIAIPFLIMIPILNFGLIDGNTKIEFPLTYNNISSWIFMLLMLPLMFWGARKTAREKFDPVIADLKKLQAELSEKNES